jgi:hypothetical protein
VHTWPGRSRWLVQNTKPVLEAVGKCHDIEVADTGGCKLNGQRQPIKAAADRGDIWRGRSVETELRGSGEGPVEEELTGSAGANVLRMRTGGHLQWRYGKDMLEPPSRHQGRPRSGR